MNILGLPRSGKTTFLKRLMGLILNIKESIDGEPNKEEPSTGIAERPHPIFVTNMGVIDDDVDNEWSISTSRKQQAKIIAQILYLLSEESYSGEWLIVGFTYCVTPQVTSCHFQQLSSVCMCEWVLCPPACLPAFVMLRKLTLFAVQLMAYMAMPSVYLLVA